MSELEQLKKAADVSARIIDVLARDDGQVEFGIAMDAFAAVLVTLFLHQEFDGMSRERAFTLFAQETFCRLKDAIDSGEDHLSKVAKNHLSNRKH